MRAHPSPAAKFPTRQLGIHIYSGGTDARSLSGHDYMRTERSFGSATFLLDKSYSFHRCRGATVVRDARTVLHLPTGIVAARSCDACATMHAARTMHRSLANVWPREVALFGQVAA